MYQYQVYYCKNVYFLYRNISLSSHRCIITVNVTFYSQYFAVFVVHEGKDSFSQCDASRGLISESWNTATAGENTTGRVRRHN